MIVADLNSLEKLKAFLNFRKSNSAWYELPPFPKAKSAYFENLLYKRKRWQAFAQTKNKGALFLASPQALLK